MPKNTKPPLDINPTLGDKVVSAIESLHGVPVHLVMMVFEHMPDGKLGQPAFVTSLQTSEMEDVIVQVAGGIALAGKPTRIQS
jgi:hypothetical protein